jgi:hypothetical protein
MIIIIIIVIIIIIIIIDVVVVVALASVVVASIEKQGNNYCSLTVLRCAKKVSRERICLRKLLSVAGDKLESTGIYLQPRTAKSFLLAGKLE